MKFDYGNFFILEQKIKDFIIYIYIFGFDYPYCNAQASDFIYFDFFQRFIGDFICRLYLPLFMSISGFLFFKNITNPSKLIWIKKYKSRFKSLLIPYIIWNILFIIQLAIFQYNPITAPWISTVITPFIESGSVIYSIWIIFIHPANLPL